MDISQLNLTNVTRILNVLEAKTRLSELLAAVERGEDVIIARAGKPVARLTAVGERPRRELGFVAGGPIPASFFDPLPDQELDAWGDE